jgi:uncharacterized protein
MKRIYIIHGWGGNPYEPLLQWLADELREAGHEVVAPEMPDTDHPQIETWVPFLQKIVGSADENTFFIGHSIGCQTILRYLETLPEGVKIGGAVFIAGWYNVRNLDTEEEKEIVGPWVNTPHDDAKIRAAINKGVVILSDNDPYVSLDNQVPWKEKAGVRVIIESGKGHYNNEEAGVTQSQTVLEEVVELLR